MLLSLKLIAGILCDMAGFHVEPTFPSPFKILCSGVVLVGTVLSTDTGTYDRELVHATSKAYFPILGEMSICH